MVDSILLAFIVICLFSCGVGLDCGSLFVVVDD